MRHVVPFVLLLASCGWRLRGAAGRCVEYEKDDTELRHTARNMTHVHNLLCDQ